ncbi:hypothetical protein H1224_06715 [Pectobacterium aroidearum]|uniref:hypothetical protein n=1 Tax=Pectobacterium aroidearum TaxID=1201031 RepID=UPI0015F6BF25|nr:hypothetical protein [Pectobacterium aroidearum]MBA5600755.1 hypothetical protein [Pectobacterium aroidearum]
MFTEKCKERTLAAIIFISFIILFFYGKKHAWAVTLLIILMPSFIGGVTFLILHKKRHDVLKKFSDAFLSVFTLIGILYYVFKITNKDPDLTLIKLLSNPQGYAFLALMAHAGVIKLCINVKDFFIEINNKDKII